MPAAYTPGSKDIGGFTPGSGLTEYNIAMLIGTEYDDPARDAPLNRVTLKETAKFCRQGRPEILSINIPRSLPVDGSAAWTKSTYKEKYDDYSAP